MTAPDVRKNPIGIFDSGLGGLTVFKQIKRKLPRESLIYFGDTARVPYGTKSPETVRRYSREIAEFLLSLNVKMIVIACNTASAVALDGIRTGMDVPVTGVIEPGAATALRTTVNKRAGIIGTAATVASGAYEKALKRLSSEVEVYSLPCPLFVPLAEEGWHDNEVAFRTAEIYLEPLKDKDIDTLILGCTHYPPLKTTIGRVMGETVTLVDSAEAAAGEVEDLLRSDGLAAPSDSTGSYGYYVTDESQRFRTVGELFLDEKLHHVEVVDLHP